MKSALVLLAVAIYVSIISLLVISTGAKIDGIFNLPLARAETTFPNPKATYNLHRSKRERNHLSPLHGQEPIQLNSNTYKKPELQQDPSHPNCALPLAKRKRSLSNQEQFLKLQNTQQANTYVPDDQHNVSGAVLSNFNFVLTWTSDGQDGSQKGVYARVFDTDGNPVTSEILVAIDTSEDQLDASVVSFPSVSKFYVTWTSDKTGTNSIYGRFFFNDGTSSTNEIEIYSQTGEDNTLSVAAVLGSEKIVTIWQLQGSGFVKTYGQFLDEDGILIGSEFFISDTPGASDMHPKVTSMGDGNFLVVWQLVASNVSIFGKILDIDAITVKSEFEIASDASTDNHHPDAATSADHSAYAVVWVRYESSDSVVLGMILDPNGNSVVGETELLRIDTSSLTDRPSVAGLEGGGYAVMWANNDDSYVTVKRFDEDLIAIGDKFSIETEVVDQLNALIALPDGGFVMAWSVDDSTGSDDVFFQVAHPCEDIIEGESGIGSVCPCPDDKENDSEGYCQCINTSSDPSTCLCYDDQYLSGTDCIDCSEHCEHCDSEGCLICEDDYLLSNTLTCSSDICEEIENCAYCPDLLECDACESGYFKDSNFGLCIADECDSIDNCLECEEDGLCLMCEDGYFFSEDSLTCEFCSPSCHECSHSGCYCEDSYYSTGSGCEECSDYCRICEDSFTCSTCEEGFSMNIDLQCVCQATQYLEDGTCVDLDITVIVQLSDNFIWIYFSEDITTELTGDLVICHAFPSNDELIPIITKESDSIYKLNFETTIPQSTVSIEIEIKELTGISGNKHFESTHTVTGTDLEFKKLEEEEEEEESEELEELNHEMEEYIAPSSNGSMSITSIIISIIMQQYSALWAFVNAAQILFFIPIHNIKLPKAVVSAYEVFGANFYIVISMTDLLGIEDKKEVTSSIWNDYGFSSSNFLINSEEILFLGFISLSLFPLFILGKYVSCFSNKLSRFFRRRILEYKWCFFLRFWIEGYLELMAAALLSVTYTESYLEFSFSLFVLVIGFLSALLISLLIFKLKKEIEHKDQVIYSTYGTFFEEFKNDKGFLSMLFYPVFCLRRMIYICVLFYLENYPVFQVSLNILCSLLTILYLVWYRPFVSSKIQNIVLSDEVIFCLNVILCSFFLMDLSDNFKFGVAMIIIISIYTMVCINIFYVISSLYYWLREKCKNEKIVSTKKILPVVDLDDIKQDDRSFIKSLDLNSRRGNEEFKEY